MIKGDLLQGRLVRLVMEDLEVAAREFSRWNRDSEYVRLSNYGPAILYSQVAVKSWLEKQLLKDPPLMHLFHIRTLENDRLVGEIGLESTEYGHRDTYVGISIGDRSDWGRGYGTDAMLIMLRYAFNELNLHRVSLSVFEYNPRAIRSYEKVGFQVEGRQRRLLQREGRRWDVVHMGILQSEWRALQAATDNGIAGKESGE